LKASNARTSKEETRHTKEAKAKKGFMKYSIKLMLMISKIKLMIF